MIQEEIINEIRKKCGNADLLTSVGWHFVYNGRHYFYISDKSDDNVLRFCVPHLIKASDYDSGLLAGAINETNRNVKFIKVMVLECGSVSIDYDYKLTSCKSAGAIVPHIINSLDFAANYFINKLKKL
ncbi:MAG: hypothetical protein LUC88_10290 [Prevotella sp.]|nr:hypothetical protein [Prevotella sp.]